MELLVIGAVGILVMAFAMTVARWLVRQPAGEHELQRTAALVSRAVRHYLKRQTTVSVALAAVIGAVVFLCYGVAYQLEMVTVVSPREHGVWVTSAYIVGAGLALAVGWVASWTSCQANMRVAGGACRSIHESLQVGVRAGAVSGVVALAAAVLGLALLFGCALWYTGNTTAAVIRAPHLVGGYALGAAFIALLSQLGGGIFGKVADIGADVAGKLEASLPEDSPQNPAAIADLVGDNVGNSAAQAVSLYATTVTELLAAMLIAGQFYGANTHLPSAIAVVLLPLVMRAFGLLGTWFGVLVVRTDDREVPMNALSRGLHVSTLLGAVAGAGTAKWLLGPHWLPFAGCIGAGAVASLLFLYIVQYYTEQKHRPVRALAEAARGGPTLAALRGMLTAAEGTVVLVLIAGAAFIGSYHLGELSDLRGGGVFGIAVALSGMLATAPYALAMDSMASMVDTAGGIIEMTVASERPDVRARARLLDALGTTVKSFTKTLAVVATTVACFLLLVAFRAAAVEQGELDVSSSSLYVAALLGLVVLLSFVWAMLSRIVGASRDLVHELRGQLALGRLAQVGSPLAPSRLGGGEEARDDPNDSSPSGSAEAQLACVEIVSRVALRGILPPAIVGVGVPLLIGVVLRAAAKGDNVAKSAEALVVLLLVATIAGALGTLLLTGAGSAWDNAKKYIETGAHGGRYLAKVSESSRGSSSSVANDEVNNPTYVAAVIGDTIGDPLKGAVGPAIQTLVTTLVTLALVFLPFFL